MVPHITDPLFQRESKSTKLPITQGEYKKIRKAIRKKGGRFISRNLLLVNLQTNTCISSSDVLKMKTGTVFRAGRILGKFWINQKSSRKSQLVTPTREMRKDIENAIREYANYFDVNYFSDPGNPLFPSQRVEPETGHYKSISYSAYRGFLSDAFKNAGLDSNSYGTHSLRIAIPLSYYQKTKDEVGAKAIFYRRSGQTTISYIERATSMKAIEIKKEFLFSE